MNNSYDLLTILNELLTKYSYKDIATNLNVAIGTVKRWVELNNIPSAYTFELLKMNNIEINYEEFTYKDKDQFYTPIETATYCFNKFKLICKEYGDSEKDYTYIEPSAGNGVFLKLFPKNRRIGMDIEPQHEDIITHDYLTWKPSKKENKYCVMGNPPFGLRGQLALKFINHSAQFADYVCFILPQLFESDGKGVPRKRVQGFNLIHSEKIESNFTYPDNKIVKVECIFQIWSKYKQNDLYKLTTHNEDLLKVYSLSDGGTSSTTRNKKMFHNCHAYIPSTCFGKENMKYYDSFESLPGKKGYGLVFYQNKESNIEKCKNINWSTVAFLSTNSAYNINTSRIFSQFSA